MANPAVRKTIAEAAEFVIETIATAVALYIIELRKRNETTKLTEGKQNVQLHSESQHHQEPEGESSGLRVVSN